MKSNFPAGWQEVELGEICKLITDGTHDKTPLVKKEEGVPLVTSKDLTENGISFENVLYISKEQHAQIIKRSKPEKGDILYSKIGTIGKPTIVEVDFEFSIKNVALFKLNKEILNKFLVYYLKFPKIHNSLNADAGGGNQKFIPLNRLEKIKILLPPLSVQKKIVSILEKAEKLKQKREEADKKTNEYLKSVFYEMFYNKGFEDKSLREICLRITDGTHKTPKYLDAGVPFLRVTDITNSNESKKFISESEHLELIKRCKPEKGDVLYTKNGTIGIAKMIDWNYEFSIFVSLCLIKPNREIILSKFLEFFLNTPFALNQAFEHSKKGTITNLHLNQINKLKIPLPPLPLQQKFASIVEKVEKLKEKQKESKEKINEMFDALMQKAFRGELV